MADTHAPQRTVQLDELIASWEQQQEAYVRHREQRFEVVLDAIGYARPEVRTVLDIGGGLGSFSRRVLDRFEHARVVTLDYDPALLALARHHLRGYADRSVLVEANLSDPSWVAELGELRPDVVLSSTALHWLRPAQLVALYAQLAKLLPAGGLFFNEDHLSRVSAGQFFDTVSVADNERQQAAFAGTVLDWDGWWQRFRAIDGFTELIDERDRRFAGTADELLQATATLHTETLRVAGFAESGTIWQYFDDYVVYGRR